MRTSAFKTECAESGKLCVGEKNRSIHRFSEFSHSLDPLLTLPGNGSGRSGAWSDQVSSMGPEKRTGAMQKPGAHQGAAIGSGQFFRYPRPLFDAARTAFAVSGVRRGDCAGATC
jgi:hypothetical protein